MNAPNQGSRKGSSESAMCQLVGKVQLADNLSGSSWLEFLLLWSGITALYRFVPNTHVAWRPLLLGSFFTALVLEAARSGLTFYLASMPTFSLVYGTFATVPILLVWIYTTWVVVLLGAVLVASWPALSNDSLDGSFSSRSYELYAISHNCFRNYWCCIII